jgi:ADP-heptose:LPS heptosyltransferase
MLDNIIIFPKLEIKTLNFLKIGRILWAFRRQLKAGDYDLCLDLQALAKSSLVVLLSGAKKRLAYWETREGSFFVSKGVKGPWANDHVIERYRDVIRYFGPVAEELVYPLPDYSAQRAELARKLALLGSSEPRAVFFPGTRWVTKLWPWEYFAALGRELAGRGVSVVLGGEPGDQELTQKILALAPEAHWVDLAGQTDLRGLMALTSLANVVVGSDSGPSHLATAVGVPTISLFGPNLPSRTGVYGPLARNLASPAPCSPCFKRICPRDFVCMSQITVEMVLRECLLALG